MFRFLIGMADADMEDAYDAYMEEGGALVSYRS